MSKSEYSDTFRLEERLSSEGAKHLKLLILLQQQNSLSWKKFAHLKKKNPLKLLTEKIVFASMKMSTAKISFFYSSH